MLTLADYAAHYPVTAHVGVARYGRDWFAYDRGTAQRIGPVFPTMYAAREYAEYRERATYAGILDPSAPYQDGAA